MGDAYIVDAIRTPIGRRGGALSGIRAEELAGVPMVALLERSGVPPAAIDDVILGCVTQVGEQGQNIARIAALTAGLPMSVPGVSVNRMCGSSQQAVNFAAMAVGSGYQDIVLAGGVESMSRVTMGSDALWEGRPVSPPEPLAWRHSIVGQGTSAELVARRYGLTRDELDAHALESHRRAAVATDEGRFEREWVAVRHANGQLERDEGVRRDTSLEKLASLRPAFQEDGVITAGNSSQISDGAAAVLLASARAIQEHGLQPRARVVAIATVGVDPTLMLTGPVPAAERALSAAGLSIGDIDAIEINEAFGSVSLGCGRALGVDFERTNVFGGAMALGHPLGASGARLMATLLNVLEQRGGRYGLCVMCIGYGQGIATIVDREMYF